MATKDIETAADMLRKKVERLPGYVSVAVTAGGLIVYTKDKSQPIPKTCGGHRVKAFSAPMTS